MTNKLIIKEFTNIVSRGNISLNEHMKNHTTFKVGGPCDVFVKPSNPDELVKVLDVCKKNKIDFFMLGNGSNVIVSDKGIRGVVIRIKDNMNSIKVEGEMLISESGALMSSIANVAMKNSLQGLEFASGIPGTVGGAVAMNAGAYGSEIKNVIWKTTFIDNDCAVKTIIGNEHNFGYRKSIIQENRGIVLTSEFKLTKGNQSDIKGQMNLLNSKRKEKQPLEMPSAGSVFKRPEGYFAGKLIQDSGLKGFSIGGAQVSTKHCGFIVNSGNGTAKDILDLIEHIKNEVNKKFGVDLTTEVKFIGEV